MAARIRLFNRGVSAEHVAHVLDGAKPLGDGWIARCPCHADRTPSLSLKDSDDGKLLVHCHAGCSQDAVIAELRSKGLWHCSGRGRRDRAIGRLPAAARIGDDRQRTAVAMRLWHSCKSAAATTVGTYLASRGISLSIPETIRFHPRLKHRDGGFWPAMVALVTRAMDGEPLAVHRTYLARDGCGKAPLGGKEKMMIGPCRGGVVRLTTPAEKLMIGEGIETCLSAMVATDLPTWAALSTSGMRAVQLPDHIREVIVLADGDPPGESAARDAATRWVREGRIVRIARAPLGMDFNDLLLSEATSL